MENSVIWSPGMKIEALEQLVILKAYRFYGNNKTATANSLGISIRTLDNKLEKYEMAEIDAEAMQHARREEREKFLARARGSHNNQYDTAATPRFNPFTQDGNEASTGFHMESLANSAAQPTVSVSEREKVQEMLPGHAADSSTRKAR